MYSVKLNKNYYLTLLYRLNSTEMSLKSTAQYLGLFNEPNEIIGGIQFIYTKSNIYHKLNLFYLTYELFKLKENKKLYKLLHQFIQTNYRIAYEEALSKNLLQEEFQSLETIFKKRGLLK
ncbi:hypothetical protein EBI_26083 [Enterocytozoon bieneusi H348]|nr:hypothetical protein EBI_26083 [Enterocytozoon bieneusi H348]|eukprot:XP_002649873.1 hypothetical protein EBI_26083 [Enterocytozoon bieneusi H348]